MEASPNRVSSPESKVFTKAQRLLEGELFERKLLGELSGLLAESTSLPWRFCFKKDGTAGVAVLDMRHISH